MLSSIKIPFAITLLKKLFVLSSSICIWLFTFYYSTPYLQKILRPLCKNILPGPRLLINHVFIFSFFTALVCFLYYLFLEKKFQLPKIQINKNTLSNALIQGTLLGIVIAIIFIPLALYRWNMNIHFTLNLWSILGNLFSNTWEEIVHRGLIMMASLYAFKNEKIAWLISGLTFAWSHEQYPLEIRVAIGIIGCSFGWIYFKTKNFAAPITAHCVSDWILDSLFP